MIVYGDPSYYACIPVVTERLGGRFDAYFSARKVDAARELIVQAGQLEQAIFDRAEELPPALLSASQELTDYAAELFVGCLAGEPVRREEIEDMLATLSSAKGWVKIKLPEGFAFYTLYPEAYWNSAREWLNDHADVPRRTAVVVGIRSIGTSLSAVVAATLRAENWEVRRVTIRPPGHPFSREASLDAAEMGDAEWALIVDEGPGLSGSSMAAAAEAVVRAGIPRDRVSFFPGHGGEPGSHASEEIRAWWNGVPRYVTSTDDLRWEGLSLSQALAQRTSVLTGKEVERVEDLGGGQWRGVVFPDPADWPAATTPFERAKYRVVLQDGEAILWKFIGFVSSPNQGFESLSSRATAGWTTAPLTEAFGFLATPWVDGQPLRASDPNAELMSQLCRYILAVSGPPLSESEARAARDRLAEMLYWNAREALGEEAARAIQTLTAPQAPDFTSPTYGDGRMSPHEWLRTPDGRILKTDSLSHAWDHTIVGPQPIAWDVAGVIVEWGLDERRLPAFLASLYEEGISIPSEKLRFYTLAYSAFRLGMVLECAAMSTASERTRLDAAADFYRASLCGSLAPDR